MKRFFVVTILFLLAFLPKVRAEGPDDQYVTIYNMIQQGDVLYEKNQTASARAKYEDALSVLKKFQTVYPDWNTKVVRFRINYLAAKMNELAPLPPHPGMVPPPAPATTNAAQKTNVAPAVPPLIITGKHEVPPPVSPAPPAPVVKQPAVEPVVPPVVKTPPPASNTDYQIIALQDQVRRLESDKVTLEAKLKEALAARPASVDPQELARTQEMVRELQKENELLKTSLAEARTNGARSTTSVSPEQTRLALAEATRKLTQLTEANATLMRERESLQARVKAMANPDAVTQALREENEILKRQVADLRTKANTNAPGEELNRKLLEAQTQLAVLQSDKELLRLEKMALESRYKEAASRTNAVPSIDTDTMEKIKRLETQRDDLQKSLDAALKEIEGHRKGKDNPVRVEQMTRELADLHARIETLEAVRIPYTREELAFFEKPTITQPPTNSAAGKRSVRELPVGAAVLIAEAKRYYAGHDFEKAEAKYLEVLKLNEKNVSTLADLATVQLALNHSAEAEKHIKTALEIEPNNDYSLMVLGQLKFQQNKFDDALDAFSRAAKLNPQDAEIQNNIGITLSEKGLRGPAETALRRAVQLDPNYASAHINLAFVYVLQKPPLIELARWHYQKALASHHPRDMKLEQLLDPPRTANAAQ